ncbi:MAG: YgjV family protein [Ruminococcaceae bacterium]|nr:YgjV family protein [Oscillospiraceae bacterium]
MDTIEIIGQVVGIVAVVISFLTYQMKSKRGILAMLSCATVLFCIHYACLKAPVGVFLNIVGIIRNLCYYHSDKKILSSKFVPIILASAMGVLGIITWEGVHSLFFVVGLMLNTLAMGYFGPQNLRKSLLLTCTLIFIYNACTFSIGGMINETVAVISAIIGLVRYRRENTTT